MSTRIVKAEWRPHDSRMSSVYEHVKLKKLSVSCNRYVDARYGRSIAFRTESPCEATDSVHRLNGATLNKLEIGKSRLQRGNLAIDSVQPDMSAIGIDEAALWQPDGFQFPHASSRISLTKDGEQVSLQKLIYREVHRGFL